MQTKTTHTQTQFLPTETKRNSTVEEMAGRKETFTIGNERNERNIYNKK